jgi:integral membrane protein
MKNSFSASALSRFRIMAIVCGVNLVLLVIYMVAKYAFDAFEESNPFIFIPIAHGYFYIVYILTVLQLAVQKRMSFLLILALVAAGTIPVASFIAERKIVQKYS